MQKGFTLIELMVAVAVIVIISCVLFVGKDKRDESFVLKMASFLISQNIREFQEKALSSEKIICPTLSDTVCGYGFNFKQNDDFYTPFADCAKNCQTSNHKLDNKDYVFSIVQLNEDIKICSLTQGVFDVVFAPPDPIIYLNNMSWQAGDSEIVLCLKSDLSKIKKVKLNNAGKVEIE